MECRLSVCLIRVLSCKWIVFFCTGLQYCQLLSDCYVETSESKPFSDEICEHSTRNLCSFDTDQCRYRHSQLPYQWQVVFLPHFYVATR